MRETIAVLLVLFGGSALARDKSAYDLKITVMRSQGVESEYRRSWVKGGGHSVTAHVRVAASDGNTYDLLGHHKEDVLVPGTYPAAVEKGNMLVCISRADGRCHELQFLIDKVERTNNQAP